jgi:ADP-ribosylglycohydrolase
MTTGRLDRIHGSLLVGAIGDALGAGVEFMPLSEIKELFGSEGATDFTPFYGHDAPITDDTQMTLFTAEGLIRAAADGTDPVQGIWAAYQRWYHTQGGPLPDGVDPDSGLLAVADLHDYRAPGMTCMGSMEAGLPGDPDVPLNDSKGCGGVMRVAPVGMVAGSDDTAYRLGCASAALTHGGPCGWISAGVLAVMIRRLIAGDNLEEAVIAGRSFAEADQRDTGVAAALDAAVELAGRAPLDGRMIEELGGGWVGEEALAIAVACVLAEPDPNQALLLAVNHSGDSDSTGAIVGNLLGALHGTGPIRVDWCERVELADVIADLAAQLVEVRIGSPVGKWKRWFQGLLVRPRSSPA